MLEEWTSFGSVVNCDSMVMELQVQKSAPVQAGREYKSHLHTYQDLQDWLLLQGKQEFVMSPGSNNNCYNLHSLGIWGLNGHTTGN